MRPSIAPLDARMWGRSCRNSMGVYRPPYKGCIKVSKAPAWRCGTDLDRARTRDAMTEPKWKRDGVRVIPGHSLDSNTAQTPGMDRKAAINLARAGAQKLWAGTVAIHPNAKNGAHHHGALESVIYVVRGKARMRWGERLEFTAEAGPGDFIFVPPYVPHQEINAST